VTPHAAVRRPRDKWPRFVVRAEMIGVRRWRRSGCVPISEPVFVSSTIFAIEAHDVEGASGDHPCWRGSRPPNLQVPWQRRGTDTQRTKCPTRAACEGKPVGDGRDRARPTRAASARADARRRRRIGGRRKARLLHATVSSRYAALVLQRAALSRGLARRFALGERSTSRGLRRPREGAPLPSSRTMTGGHS
jgi:hypothetical protein